MRFSSLLKETFKPLERSLSNLLEGAFQASGKESFEPLEEDFQVSGKESVKPIGRGLSGHLNEIFQAFSIRLFKPHERG